MAELSDFLDSLDPDQAAPLRRIVAIALAEAPEATEGTSYGMPALRVGGRPLVGMARATGHLSLFPFSADVVAGVADRRRHRGGRVLARQGNHPLRAGSAHP